MSTIKNYLELQCLKKDRRCAKSYLFEAAVRNEQAVSGPLFVLLKGFSHGLNRFFRFVFGGFHQCELAEDALYFLLVFGWYA